MTISVKQNNTFSTATGVWVKVSGVWKQVGGSELPGIGGWATITSVTGNPKRYAYNDGNMDWVAFEWAGTNNGSGTEVTGSITTTEGLLDCVIVGGGGYNSTAADGAFIAHGALDYKAGTHSIVVGLGYWPGQHVSSYSGMGPHNAADAIIGTGNNRGAIGKTPPFSPDGLSSKIANGVTTVEYGAAGSKGKTTPGSGGGTKGYDGVVIARVPAAHAAGVTRSSWVESSTYFAAVTDGVVTDTHVEHVFGDGSVSPMPSGEWLPADHSVQVGWDYVDGVFSAPTTAQMPSEPDDV